MSTRDFLVNFLKQCQDGETVAVVGGKAAKNPIMSEEEAILRLALFDKEVEPTLDIEIKLAQYEAMRWPKSARAQGRLWKLMRQKESE